MTEEIRYIRVPDAWLRPELRMPMPMVAVYVSVVDALYALDQEDGCERLRVALEELVPPLDAQ